MEKQPYTGSSKIHIIAQAALAELIQLLRACDLPTSDLVDGSLENFLCYRHGARLDGVIGLEIYGEDGLLRSLAVAANARQTGIGRQLVSALEQHAQAIGIKQLYLLTETAAPFFTKLGFDAIARSDAAAAIKTTEEFASLCPQDAIVMRKRYP